MVSLEILFTKVGENFQNKENCEKWDEICFNEFHATKKVMLYCDSFKFHRDVTLRLKSTSTYHIIEVKLSCHVSLTHYNLGFRPLNWSMRFR